MFTFDVSQNLVNSDPHGSFELLVSFRYPTPFNGDAPGSFGLAAWLGSVNDDTSWGRSADPELLYCSTTKTYTFVFQFMQNALSVHMGTGQVLSIDVISPV